MTGLERLTCLAEGLREFHKHPLKINGVSIGFDLGHWYCGYAACAIGHAAFIPKLAEEGLILVRLDGAIKYPVFKYSTQWNAVEHFFGITHTVAHKLFSHRAYGVLDADALTVAERIETYVEGAGE